MTEVFMSYRIEEIDKNFAPVSLDGLDVVFKNVTDEPFRLYGLTVPASKDSDFRRIPKIEGVNGGVFHLSKNTAGVRARFSTTSPYIAIYAEIGDAYHMAHMPLSGSCGFDLYVLEGSEERHVRPMIPPTGVCHGQQHYHSIVKLSNKAFEKERTYTLYFPLYNGVKKLEIGVAPGSILGEGEPYTQKKPVVYYGSSITQGGCASRAGNAYPAFITHKLNLDHLNLGFSGSCVAEREMAEYIAGLEMCAFVYDYDYNAPTPDYLRETHEPFFSIIRKYNPNLPVIILSAPCAPKNGDDCTRRDIIKATYESAKAKGDKNVYFIDGTQIFDGIFADSCTVDSVHPNDLGFARMAEKLIPVIKESLNI